MRERMKPGASGIAVATAAATLVLILVGGLVTNLGVGLAVPDWPTTFGHNMFLFPWSGMVGGVLYEHTHRLIGSVVGALTVALAVALWWRGPLLRRLGVAAAVLVVLQGVLGGLRVVLPSDALAPLHGAVGQAFFALLVAVAALTARAVAPDAVATRGAAWLLGAAAALVYFQIVSGTLVTHARHLDLHVVGGMAVYAVVPQAALGMVRSGDRAAALTARAMLLLLAVQLALGAGSYWSRFASLALPGDPASALALPVVHRVVGSLILAGAVVLAIRTTRTAGP